MAVKTNKKTLLEVLTENIIFDSSGQLQSNLAIWTESTIYETFARMWTVDDHIRGGLKIRKSEVLSYGWTIEGDDVSDEMKADVLEMLKSFEIIEQLGQVWNAVPMGFSVVETMWELVEGRYVPSEWKGVPCENVTLTASGPIVKQMGKADINTWETPYKWIMTSYDALYRNPEGMPVLASCYWPWIFKRLGFRFWSTLLEKFGIPSLVALLKSDIPLESVDGDNGITIAGATTDILNAMKLMKTGGNAVFSNVDEVKILEASGKGDDYSAFITELNNAISISILGNTMTMDSQSRGSQALGTVHQEISKQVSRGDADMLAKAVNVLIRWYVELNYGVGTPAPQFVWDLDGETSWEMILNAIDRGLPVSQKALYQRLRGMEPTDEADAFIAPSVQSEPSGVGLSRPFARPSLPGRRKTQSPH